MAKGWKVDLGLPLVDGYLRHIFDIGHTSSCSLERLSACFATNIPGWGLYRLRISLLCDSHISPHVIIPIRVPLPQGAHTINMALNMNAYTTSFLRITNNEKPFYAPFQPLPYLRVMTLTSKKLLRGPSSSAHLDVIHPDQGLLCKTRACHVFNNNHLRKARPQRSCQQAKESAWEFWHLEICFRTKFLNWAWAWFTLARYPYILSS